MSEKPLDRDNIQAIRALKARNGGGKPMKPGKVYKVPNPMPLKDAIYLINTKAAVQVHPGEKDVNFDDAKAVVPPPPGSKGVNSGSGLKG